jgi:hypothetical protein
LRSFRGGPTERQGASAAVIAVKGAVADYVGIRGMASGGATRWSRLKIFIDFVLVLF